MGDVLDEPAGALFALLALQPLQFGADLLVALGERLHQLGGHADDGTVPQRSGSAHRMPRVRVSWCW
jgi:hypothetical protein